MPHVKQWLRAHPEAWITVYFAFYLATFFYTGTVHTAPLYRALCAGRSHSFQPLGPSSLCVLVCMDARFRILPPAQRQGRLPAPGFIMFTGMTVCLVLYAALPTGLALRRPLPHGDVLCRLVGLLRSIDPPANVCPSIHISSTAAICIVLLRLRLLAGKWVSRPLWSL